MDNQDLVDRLRIQAENIEPHLHETMRLAAAALEADGWCCMGTAPKGGGAELVTDPNWVEPPHILLMFEGKQISVACWDWSYGGVGYYNIGGEAWIEPVSGECLHLHYGMPTKWMPIPHPKAPEPRETGAYGLDVLLKAGATVIRVPEEDIEAHIDFVESHPVGETE